MTAYSEAASNDQVTMWLTAFGSRDECLAFALQTTATIEERYRCTIREVDRAVAAASFPRSKHN